MLSRDQPRQLPEEFVQRARRGGSLCAYIRGGGNPVWLADSRLRCDEQSFSPGVGTDRTESERGNEMAPRNVDSPVQWNAGVDRTSLSRALQGAFARAGIFIRFGLPLHPPQPRAGQIGESG